MRAITSVTIHCAATKPSMDIGVDDIRKWHTQPKHNADGTYSYMGKRYKDKTDLPRAQQNRKGRGWQDVGYHYVIRQDGTLEDGRPNQKQGAHAAGHNKNSIGICLVGGIDEAGKPEAKYSKAQLSCLRSLVNFLQDLYGVLSSQVQGHCDLPGVKKACPCFDVSHWKRTGKLRASPE